MAGSKTSFLWLAPALALLCAMPSTRSLWIDEAQTYMYVAHGTLGEWFSQIWKDGYSEAQMPLSMFVAWAWGKIVPPTEFGLRSVNLLWAIGSILGMWQIGRRLVIPWLPLFFAIQPFVWFYVDEARPYALQICAGTWLLVGLTEIIEQKRVTGPAGAIFSFAAVVLAASSLLATISLAAILLVAITAIKVRSGSIDRNARLPLVGGALLLLLLGVYYIRTLARGASGAKIWNVDLLNVGFSLYEFMGFAGLGPGRQELRDLGRTFSGGGALEILPYILAITGPALLYCCLFLSASNDGRSSLEKAYLSATVKVFIAGLCLLFAASLIVGFPFWGRHLAPLFPFFVVSLALLFKCPARRWRQVSLILLGVSLLGSSTLLRFSSRHAKDDYRGAAELGKQALQSGQRVWWIADRNAAIYYGLPLSQDPHDSSKALLMNFPTDEGSTLPPTPDLIIFSKPDVYDRSGAVRRYLSDHGWQQSLGLQAFTLWRRNVLGDMRDSDRIMGQVLFPERCPSLPREMLNCEGETIHSLGRQIVWTSVASSH